jgi:hypothetical protein
MNFYVVFCKTKRKFDKYIKINKIRNKVIIDIKEILLEINEKDINNISHKEYFNLIVYTKILHSLKKGKDIYYIPDYNCNKINIKELLKIKETTNFKINFNLLLFYDEFKDDDHFIKNIFDNMDIFNSSQIIKDY